MIPTVPPSFANAAPDVLENMMVGMIGKMIKEFPDELLVRIADMILDEQVKRNADKSHN